MHQEQRHPTHALLREKGIDQAIFGRRESITWLTGFAPPVQTGSNPFAAGNPILWYDRGEFTLIVVNQLETLATSFGDEPDGQVISYAGYTLDSPIVSSQNLLDAFHTIATIHTGRIGVERSFVSDLITGPLERSTIVDIDGWLEPLRMIKTEEELAVLRRNFALTDIGHAAAREAVAVGKREIDVWNAMHEAIQAAAGCRVPVGNDCIVGRRQANIGGWPEDYELHPGESLIVDISVVLDGYWSDSCATYYAGERSALQAKLHQTVRDSLDFVCSLLRPGAVCGEIDHAVREFIAEKSGYPVYPHHTGHGLGTSGHERPRIVPNSTDVLGEGMVVAVEPGIYLPGETSVRLEDVFLVQADGVEKLTNHDIS